eukprot:TRINITY_DN33314_c0_g1_i1.p1 TRINITY_DN33314_c0_g1~~TRINITY_DN33314_c0_g1_i1.p1  ORF type:complete len:2803 (+),score=449.95 TRINITY_DN33314_c0_g1_i1:36-8444(+)
MSPSARPDVESKPSSIWEWLVAVDDDLGVYADRFMKFGYDNLNLLRKAKKNELQEDLTEMGAKKHHCRLILRSLDDLQKNVSTRFSPVPRLHPQESAASAGKSSSSSNGLKPSGIASRGDLSSLFPPLFTDVAQFMEKEMPHLQQHLGSGRPLSIPVLCLRWMQGGIHGQMIFTSGRRKDCSIYEFLHELLSGRESIAALGPLEVVLDGGSLYCLSNRRLSVLICFQAMQRHKVVRAECCVYAPGDSQVSDRYKGKDTSSHLGDGLGIQLHGQQEAWHLGKPLFRCAEEWCDPQTDATTRDQEQNVTLPPPHPRLPPAPPPPPRPLPPKPCESSTSSLSTVQPERVQLHEDSIIDQALSVTHLFVHSQGGWATAALSSSTVRDALLQERHITVGGVRIEVKPFVPRSGKETDTLFFGWSSKAARSNPVSKQALKAFFDEKHVEVTDPLKRPRSELPSPSGSHQTRQLEQNNQSMHDGDLAGMSQTLIASSDVANGEGSMVRVRKYQHRGCATVTFDSIPVRDAILQECSRITVAGVRMEVKPFVNKHTGKESSNMLFLGWGDSIEKSTPVGQDDLDNFFNKKHVEITSRLNAKWQEPSGTSGNQMLQWVLDFVSAKGGSIRSEQLAPLYKQHPELKEVLGNRQLRQFCEAHPELDYVGAKWDGGAATVRLANLPSDPATPASSKDSFEANATARHAESSDDQNLQWILEFVESKGGSVESQDLHLLYSVHPEVREVLGQGCIRAYCKAHPELEYIAPAKSGGTATLRARMQNHSSSLETCKRDMTPEPAAAVADYSGLKKGMKVQVKSGSKYYLAEVVCVSAASRRADAPVEIHYEGYTEGSREWVGADRLRSKALQFSQAVATKKAPVHVPKRVQPVSSSSSSDAVGHATSTTDMTASQGPLPWAVNEESDTDQHEGPLNVAIEAVQQTLENSGLQSGWTHALAEALHEPSRSGKVLSILVDHGWTGTQFEGPPDRHQLLKQLKTARDEADGESDYSSRCSERGEHVDEDIGTQQTDDIASSCESVLDTLESTLERQPDILRLKQLSGILICGTFRCVSASLDSKRQDNCGEVIVERGPKPLIGCKVRVIGQADRRKAWDFDRCWVRILLGKLFLPDGNRGSASSLLDSMTMQRTELYGRVVKAEAFGATRQKLFVCSRSKKVKSRKYVLFKPINGKLPAIQVPWDSDELPDISDLHVVEVIDWTGTLPHGRYTENLRMHSRDSDASIMEAVKISMNFCDWDDEEVLRTPSLCMNSSLDLDSSRRKDLRRMGPMVGIQHKQLPVSILLSSFPDEGPSVQVHVVDINAYLDAPELGDLDKLARQRAVGVWFLDHLDDPLEAMLPLFPPDVEKCLSFAAGSERYAMTFSFPVDEHTGLVKVEEGRVTETIVRCDSVLSPSDAGAMVLDQKDGGEVGRLLRSLFQCICKFEAKEEDRGSFALLEHLEVDFKADPARSSGSGIRDASLASQRLIAGCSYIVNSLAGRMLAETKCWSQLLQEDDGSQPFSLTYTHGRPDPSTWNVIERLLRYRPGASDQNLKLKDVLSELRAILHKPGLTLEQQHCLQVSFVRRMRNTFPYAYYSVLGKSETTEMPSAANGDLFRHEPFFHVTAPLQRYLDILGLRALKYQAGWRNSNAHLQLKKQELEQAVCRANSRYAAHRFALYIFRQISWMRKLSRCGRAVEDAVIGAVGPSYINVLIPALTSQTLELKVPVSALRSPSCFVEYDMATQSLKVTSADAAEPRDRCTWPINSWCDNKVGCIVSRNFAQPIPHHASPSSIIVSDLMFRGSNAQQQLRIGIAHKMYPEMFSSWPDLSQWAKIDSDVNTYSAIWSRIRLCQVHAAAASSAAYTAPAAARDLKWAKKEGRWSFQCTTFVKFMQQNQWLSSGDMAILRCTAQDGEVKLYGLIQHAHVKKHPAKRVQDWPENKVESEKELEIEVQLSEVSCYIKAEQQAFLETSKSFEIQLISVPPNEKKSVELLRSIPTSQSLVGLRLTVPQTAEQKKREMESRPLATVQQVSNALRSPKFLVSRDKGLNDQQLVATQSALQKSFSMVQGPPGTGKTTFLVRLIASILSLEMDTTLKSDHERCRPQMHDAHQEPARLLVCAPSNHAADEVVSRLIHDTSIPHEYITRVYSRFTERAHGCWYKGRPQITHDRHEIKPDLEEHALHFKVSQLRKVRPLEEADQRVYDEAYEQGEEQVLKKSRIVVTTCTNALVHTALMKAEPSKSRGAPSKVFRMSVKFGTVVIDEAAQASEPDVVMPTMLAAGRVVVVGDHKQLGPVVTERNQCALFVNALETSFLERMLKTPQRLTASTMLNVQYRMHPSIRRFPSAQFYDSKLQDKVSIKYRPELGCIWPTKNEHVLFIDCQTPQSVGLSVEKGRGAGSDAISSEGDTSLKNVGEAKLVLDVCAMLLEQGKCSPSDIAIITPYKAQQQEVRKKLSNRFKTESSKISVGTVHSLQGSEREFIIISFVRSFKEDVCDIHAADSCGMILSTDKQSAALRQLCMTHLGILSNRRLLNVALTRAKYGLVCIGNRPVLSNGSKDFFDFTQGLEKRDCIVSRESFITRTRNCRNRTMQRHSEMDKFVCPEDSLSNAGDDHEGSNVGAAPSNASRGSVSSAGTSLISAVSVGGATRCFLTDVLFKRPDQSWVPALSLEQGMEICAAHGGTTQVEDVKIHARRVQRLVHLETRTAKLTVTETHRVMVQRRSGPQPLQASALKIDDDVCVHCGGKNSVERLTRTEIFEASVGIVEITFEPDEAVEAIHPDSILSKGHGYAKTRRSQRKRKPTETVSIPDTDSNDGWR